MDDFRSFEDVPGPLRRDATLERERRLARPAAIAGAVAAIATLAALVVEILAGQSAPTGENKEPEWLQFVHDNAATLIGSHALAAVGSVAIAVVAYYLWVATRNRNPSAPKITIVMGVVGPILFGLGTLLTIVVTALSATSYVKSPATAEREAKIERAEANKAAADRAVQKAQKAAQPAKGTAAGEKPGGAAGKEAGADAGKRTGDGKSDGGGSAKEREALRKAQADQKKAAAELTAARDAQVKAARSELSGPPRVAAGIVQVMGIIATGFWFLIGSLMSMRVGLLTRPVGILGIVVGPLLVFPIVGFLAVQVLMAFWLGAMALIFIDRWPGGRPPAWESGTAMPWPSARQRREDLANRGRTDPGGSEDLEGRADDAVVDGDEADAIGSRNGSGSNATSRRKRRKR